jgi:hypothetical protein
MTYFFMSSDSRGECCANLFKRTSIGAIPVYRQKGNRYDKAIKILLLYQKTQTSSGPNAYEQFHELACQKTCWRRAPAQINASPTIRKDRLAAVSSKPIRYFAQVAAIAVAFFRFLRNQRI